MISLASVGAAILVLLVIAAVVMSAIALWRSVGSRGRRGLAGATGAPGATGATSTGGGGSDLSLAPFGDTPNAEGATLTDGVLQLQPASATFPGGVTTDAQALAGEKTFVDGILFSNPTGDVSTGTLLNYYETIAGTVDIHLGATTVPNVRWTLSRVGDTVTLVLQTWGGTLDGTTVTSDPFIPARFFPGPPAGGTAAGFPVQMSYVASDTTAWNVGWLLIVSDSSASRLIWQTIQGNDFATGNGVSSQTFALTWTMVDPTIYNI